jgi:enamine deaminase RidA (YjgF/YER057c/UK114 family)
MTAEEKLISLGIELPEVPVPLGSYVSFVRTGNLIYLSGMLPLSGGKLAYSGRVGQSVTLDEAVEAARISAVNALAVLKAGAGSLHKVRRCVKVTGFVSSAPDFIEQPKVINGASDLMFEVFGEKGRHARAAVGVNVLPMNAPVEIDFIFEMEG